MWGREKEGKLASCRAVPRAGGAGSEKAWAAKGKVPALSGDWPPGTAPPRDAGQVTSLLRLLLGVRGYERRHIVQLSQADREWTHFRSTVRADPHGVFLLCLRQRTLASLELVPAVQLG